MVDVTLQLHPLDVLMFRESRWFGTSAGESQSVFPLPRTIAGAVRTYLMDACGTDYSALREAVRDARRETDRQRYLTVLKDKLRCTCPEAEWAVNARIVGPFIGKGRVRYYPCPKTIVREKTSALSYGVTALRPVEATLTAYGERHPLAPTVQFPWEALPETWISDGELSAYLDGAIAVPGQALLEQCARETIMLDEPRVGVGIAPSTYAAESGLLYTSTFSRLAFGWHLEVDVRLDTAGGDRLREFAMQRPWLRVGGDGKAARVEIAQTAHQPPGSPPAGRPFAYLATPALFAGGDWLPNGLPAPVAAVTDKPVAVSGWDLAANRPMWSRYAVPAGAVYFFDNNTAVPHGECISDDPDDSGSGWGYCLKGAW